MLMFICAYLRAAVDLVLNVWILFFFLLIFFFPSAFCLFVCNVCEWFGLLPGSSSHARFRRRLKSIAEFIVRKLGHLSAASVL